MQQLQKFLKGATWLVAFALGALLAFSSGVLAQQNTHNVAVNTAVSSNNPTPTSDQEPLVRQALRTMSDQLQAATSFSFSARIMREEPGTNGQMLDFFRHVNVQVQRPNKMRMEVRSDTSKVNFWYDGKNVTMMPEAVKIYTVIPAPPTIDGTLAMLKEKLEVHSPLRPFLSSDPYAMLMDGVQSADEVGVVSVADERLLHLAFREPAADWQLWLTGPNHVLPHRMAIIYKNVEGQPRVEVEFSNWNLNAQIPASAFVFSKPEGATEVSLNALRPREAQQGGKAK